MEMEDIGSKFERSEQFQSRPRKEDEPCWIVRIIPSRFSIESGTIEKLILNQKIHRDIRSGKCGTLHAPRQNTLPHTDRYGGLQHLSFFEDVPNVLSPIKT